MLVKIDTREQELFKRCEQIKNSVVKYNDIKLVSQTLPLGDIIISDGETDHIIIERKSLSDLASSITDGRYEEQSYRLNGLQHHNHNIIYLIEGDMFRYNAFKDRIDKQTLYSAMFSINFFKGFSIMRSNNIDETAIIVCNMVYKLVGGLKLGKTPYYKANTDTDNKMNDTDTDNKMVADNNDKICEKDYCNVVKKVKKDNVTAENIGEIMLCQIPGVSSTTALAILSQFKTLPLLIKAIQDDEKCLDNVVTTDSNGKSRKISKTAISTIIKFLK